ncbi:MAG: UDP-N-acetylmuramoyl-L-alanine--D-glutamate ligase [Alphaproteobacteria bacterium]|nr:UDP-N-acetylmuramoyl-L-alanine--D-glutamate ligase [Alphaproteobacteria bacterium]
MILLAFASGKKYGVLGLGKSGRATVESLQASGAQVVAWDDGEAARSVAQKEFPGLALLPVAQWEYAGLAALVVSPGITLTHPAVLAAQRQGVEVLGDVELLWRAQPKARYIGITGTNGKSTTTTLIAHVLTACGKRVEVGGNLGTPALALAPLGAEGIYVLELSSYQLDLIRSTRFHTALLLNISPDHLDHHGTMEHYVAAKKHIFERMQKSDVAIVGVDDAASEAIARALIAGKRQCVIPISAKRPVDNGISVANGMLLNRFGLRAMTGDIAAVKSLRGEHNGQNAAAAYAACLVNGCAHEAIIAAMQSYTGLAHRMQWLGEIGGVQFVNDSKATNADAAEKALKTYDAIYWIAGGLAKEGGIAPLTEYFPKIRHAYLIGDAAADFARTLEGQVAYSACDTLDKAFAAASHDAARDGVKGAVVLLSPACASFDQFANFEVRGDAFVQLFEQLKAGKTGGSHAATA